MADFGGEISEILLNALALTANAPNQRGEINRNFVFDHT